MPPAVDVRHVAKSYYAGLAGCRASVRVLVDVTLRASAGEVVGVCGAAGAGKTTLLRCVAGLLQPDRGEVRWFGMSAAWHRRRACAVAFVAEPPPDHAFLTARQSLEYVASRGRDGVPSPELLVRESAELDSLLDRVGLAREADWRLAALPRAAAARLALARALLERPRILLLDAILDGLGARARGALARVVLDVAAEGVACLVTGREYAALRGSADRIVMLVDGRVEDRAADAVVADEHRAPRRALRVAEGGGGGRPVR